MASILADPLAPAAEAAALAARSRAEVDALLGVLFEKAAVGIALVGLEGAEREVVLEANASFAQTLGRTLGALRGTRALSASVDPAHAPGLARAMEELLRGAGTVHRGEYRFTRADGERMWIDLTASVVGGADGAPRRRLVHILDVTAQHSGTYADRRRFTTAPA